MPTITRIDMIVLPDNTVRVFKFPDNWYEDNTPPAENYISEKSLDEMLTWLKDHGWTVRTWEKGLWLGGARAFLGEPKPIRGSGEIKRRRDQLRQTYSGARPYSYNTNGLDFAYDT